MAFKPNYRMERAQRERQKEARNAEKQKALEERAAQRKAEEDATPGTPPADANKD
jgi:hypothetical protein